MRATHKREPLRIAPAILRDKRRTLPRYAEGFSELLVEHIGEVLSAGGSAHGDGQAAPGVTPVQRSTNRGVCLTLNPEPDRRSPKPTRTTGDAHVSLDA